MIFRYLHKVGGMSHREIADIPSDALHLYMPQPDEPKQTVRMNSTQFRAYEAARNKAAAQGQALTPKQFMENR